MIEYSGFRFYYLNQLQSCPHTEILLKKYHETVFQTFLLHKMPKFVHILIFFNTKRLIIKMLY